MEQMKDTEVVSESGVNRGSEQEQSDQAIKLCCVCSALTRGLCKWTDRLGL